MGEDFELMKGKEMNKKMIVIGAVAAAVVVAFFVGWYVMFVHFGRGPAFPFLPTVEIKAEGMKAVPLAEEPLIALAETEEEAAEIAELYGITLVSFEYGVAVYQTEEDPFEVIARGEKNGYPQLSINYVQEAFEPTEPIEPTESIRLTDPIKPTELYNGQ